MARALQQPSRTRLARSYGSRLVQGLRQKSSWFIKNIVKARPDAVVRAEPRILRRHPRTARRNELHFAGRVQVSVARQELVRRPHSVRSRAPRSTRAWLQVISDIPAADQTTGVALPSAPAQGKTLKSVRRLKRIGGRPVVALTVVGEEQESDFEDFGNPCSFAEEDSSVPSEYHTALSHLTDLSGLGSCPFPRFIDEDSGVVFARVCLGPDERSLPATGSFTGEYSSTLDASVPITPIAQGSGTACPSLLAAPSLMLTLPTPQIAHSPVFVPRSPITLSKYVEATTPVCGSNPLAPPSPATSCASPSLSPAPSVPSCDRCCLGQLERDGIVCRACEKQWLACKMWYQAHDGGRRRWLTEPYIKPAESTASVRAVMGSVLGVSGRNGNGGGRGSATASTRGLGFGSSVSFKKELPFKVLPTPSGPSAPRLGTGSSNSNFGWSSGVTQAWARTAKAASRLSFVRRDAAVHAVPVPASPDATSRATGIGDHQRRPSLGGSGSGCSGIGSGSGSGSGSTSECCSGDVGGILCSGSARSERSGRQGLIAAGAAGCMRRAGLRAAGPTEWRAACRRRVTGLAAGETFWDTLR
ncbi:hypothetical protein GY45DRAFT_1359275 [Cubamyces sp. BRFM 1775]|nr:hypothetical protein GY45DRAFT_1359275 [Cubamyces sp. BRFM 1775]